MLSITPFRSVAALGLMVIAVAIHPTVSRGDVINNGLVNTVDSTVNDFIEVSNGPGDTPTTVIFNPGANITGTDSFDDTVFAEDTSRVVINGGSYVNDVSGYDASSLTINGGLLGDDLFVTDDATLLLTGGTVSDDLEVVGDASATITGGTIRSDIEASRRATIDIFGGEFQGLGLDVGIGSGGNSVITLYGPEFQINGSAAEFGEISQTFGTLSGTLSDGSTFSLPFERIVEGRFFPSRGDIVLVEQAIPEPTSLVLVLGGAGVVLFYRRRRDEDDAD